MTIEEIAAELLVPHPENANHMPVDVLRKLRRHLERSGRYEPLVVRRHPELAGRFQILNGHHRLRALQQLGHDSISCLVWDADDDQARLYLATLNRLSGQDIPERRATLVEHLLDLFDLDDLAALLPEDRRQIEAIERLIQSDDGRPAALAEEVPASNPPVILDFMVDQRGCKQIHLALDMFRVEHGETISNGEALVGLATFFLERCRPGGGE